MTNIVILGYHKRPKPQLLLKYVAKPIPPHHRGAGIRIFYAYELHYRHLHIILHARKGRRAKPAAQIPNKTFLWYAPGLLFHATMQLFGPPTLKGEDFRLYPKTL